jgi:DTW domain-containing protein YfiP
MKLLLHSRELARVSNSGLLAAQMIGSMKEVHYGTPDYRFKPEDIISPSKLNLVLYPDASRSISSYVKENVSAKDINLIIPDGNWPQANSMTKKLVSTGKFSPVRLENPTGGRYWLRIDHNHAEGVSTLEAIASVLEALSLGAEASTLRSGFERFVYESLLIRGKKDLALEFLHSSNYLEIVRK